MLLNDMEYEKVWKRVYNELGFKPGIDIDEPFNLKIPYVVYDVGNANFDAIKVVIEEIFDKCAKPKEKMYALDWQHESFLYNPHDKKDMEGILPYYPDGDYYFFISEKFRFGYLGHPWKGMVWIFGKELIRLFKEKEEELGYIDISLR